MSAVERDMKVTTITNITEHLIGKTLTHWQQLFEVLTKTHMGYI